MAPDPAQHGSVRPVLLLVEDHADTRHMYAEFLEAVFRVVEAADGQDAVEIMGRNLPDVVITDLSLPRVDGFELIGRIRADPTLRHVPVICLSGYSGQAHEARARAAGCDRILQKPCMPDALAEAALQLLEQARNPRG